MASDGWPRSRVPSPLASCRASPSQALSSSVLRPRGNCNCMATSDCRHVSPVEPPPADHHAEDREAAEQDAQHGRNHEPGTSLFFLLSPLCVLTRGKLTAQRDHDLRHRIHIDLRPRLAGNY